MSLNSSIASLTVSASGSTVPAFGAQTVVAPNPIALTLPALAADGGTSTVSTASNLTVTWVGGQAGATVTLEGAGDTTQTPFVYFVCNWDASLGTGTIPQAMLTPLTGQSAGVLFYGQYTSHDFTAGSYSISEYALPYASSPVNFE